MSSTISAGTTSGTAIAISGDTSGQLVLQTNGTTTAVTISTGQVVTLAQPLPVASGGSGVTTSTGTGAVVLGTSPTMATPTFDSAQLATVVGTAPLYMCRAWLKYNGATPAIEASGNVSSVTVVGTGQYYINFTVAMPDTAYATVAGKQNSTTNTGAFIATTDNSASTSRSGDLQTFENDVATNVHRMTVAIFR